MSVSMYQGQVTRLTKDLADLEAKIADEQGKATKERGEALRIAESASRTTSESSLRQKMRDAQRREEKAAAHAKKAAQLGSQAATKRRSLTGAEQSLAAATKREQEKETRETKRRQDEARRITEREDREAKKRREEERRHLAEMERRRRELQQPAFVALPAPAVRAPDGPPRDPVQARSYEYDVCLSFAGEERPYVEMVAQDLKRRGLKVFYDQDEASTLWGKDLAEHLDYVYRKASRYCVIFVSEAYSRKEWTRHERRSALARAVAEEGEYVLPVRFDDTELDGLRPSVAYLDLRQYAPATIGDFLVDKLGRTPID